jgi:hypothetical protein
MGRMNEGRSSNSTGLNNPNGGSMATATGLLSNIIELTKMRHGLHGMVLVVCKLHQIKFEFAHPE